MAKTKAETKKDSTVLERIFGWHHHMHTIDGENADGEKTQVTARASTAEEAQKRASKKWRQKTQRGS